MFPGDCGCRAIEMPGLVEMDGNWMVDGKPVGTGAGSSMRGNWGCGVRLERKKAERHSLPRLEKWDAFGFLGNRGERIAWAGGKATTQGDAQGGGSWKRRGSSRRKRSGRTERGRAFGDIVRS